MGQISDPFSLDGRTAIVTGASRGIGWSICEMLAARGAQVFGVARSEKPDAPFSDGIEYDPCDITNIEAFWEYCQAIQRRTARLDILVNNAGVFVPPEGPSAKDRLTAFDSTLQVNLRAAYACSLAAFDLMLEAGHGGSIINITSVGAELGFAGTAGYAAAKGGLAQLSRQMAVEFGLHGVRVNSVSPGYILTDMNRDTLKDEADRKRRLDRLIIKRHGEVDEVAAACAYLASPASSYITGETLHVDGGWTVLGANPKPI